MVSQSANPEQAEWPTAREVERRLTTPCAGLEGASEVVRIEEGATGAWSPLRPPPGRSRSVAIVLESWRILADAGGDRRTTASEPTERGGRPLRASSPGRVPGAWRTRILIIIK
jgi:hypothetical protein